MVLIFEGADLAGKTTLAAHYLRALRLPVLKVRWDLADERAETVALAKMTVGLLAATKAGVILDRSFVSMWAYSTGPDDYVGPLIEALRFVPDLHLIVLTMGAKELHRRYLLRPDAYFSEERLTAVDERFAALPARFGGSIDVLHLDTAELSPDECVVRIDNHLSLRTGPVNLDAPALQRVVTIPMGQIPVAIAFPE